MYFANTLTLGVTVMRPTIEVIEVNHFVAAFQCMQHYPEAARPAPTLVFVEELSEVLKPAPSAR